MKIKVLLKLTPIVISMLILTSCSNLDIQTLNNKAMDLMKTGNIDGAIGRLESINDLNPNYPQTHYNLGIAYHKKGDYEQAIHSLNQALKLKKEFAEAKYTLGVIYEEIALTKIEKLDSDKKSYTSDEISLILDNLKQSKEQFEQYIELTGNSQEIDTIKSKIDYLNIDITKFDTILTEITSKDN